MPSPNRAKPARLGASPRSRQKNAGLNDEKVGRVALIATKLVTHLIKYAGQGYLIMNRFADVDEGFELLALDKGPGIADLNRALSDGFSTSGTLGGGLGAVARQADRFAIFSRPKLGTAVLARFAASPAPRDRRGIVIGAVLEPYPGERICGDGWVYACGPEGGVDGGTVLVADGSGHGEYAARAAAVATETFLANSNRDCVRLVETIHRALAPTRGAALAVARLDRKERVVRFVGIGNTTGSMLVEGQLRHIVSHNGTAGHIAPRIREFVYPFTGEPTLILHSDGMSARWDPALFPGLGTAHPALIAGILHCDHWQGRDDCSVVVLRAAAMKPRLLRVALERDTDIVLARRHTRRIAELLGYDLHAQTRITTAVSEIARNAVEHGGGGAIEFCLNPAGGNSGNTASLEIVISDRGPGIPETREAGEQRSRAPDWVSV